MDSHVVAMRKQLLTESTAHNKFQDCDDGDNDNEGGITSVHRLSCDICGAETIDADNEGRPHYDLHVHGAVERKAVVGPG